MATPEEIQQAIQCLAEVYPQAVADQLSKATGDIKALIEKVRDPIETLREIDLDKILSATDFTAGDEIWDNVAVVAGGLTEKLTRRQVSEYLDEIETEALGNKQIQNIRNISNKVVNRTALLLGFTPDMPFAAAQRTCELIVSTCDLKIQNLRCAQTHVIQLVNAIIVLAENVDDFADEIFDDLEQVKDELTRASLELTRTQKLVDGQVGFDSEAFDRAQGALRNVNAILSPPKGDESIIELTRILTLGDVNAAQVNESNRKLVRTVIPQLAQLLEQEASSYEQHVKAITSLIQSLSEVTQQFEEAGQTERLQEQRARAIAKMKERVDDLCNQVSLAITRRAVTSSSQEMLAWISKVKATISTMDEVRKLNYEIAAQPGDVDAEQTQLELDTLSADLEGLQVVLADLGVEDSSIISSQLRTLARGAIRILDDFDTGRATDASIRSLHAIAAVVGTNSSSNIDDSIDLAQEQQLQCTPFVSIAVTGRALFDRAVDMLNEVNLDLGVDLFRTGRFKDFLSRDTDLLTYAGAGIDCLTKALDGIDDTFTRQKVIDIRDKLIGQQTLIQFGGADSADFGILKQVEAVQKRITEIRQDARQVETIVDQLTQLLEDLGGFAGALGAIDNFALNLGKLAVSAGGRLAADLEQLSEFPDAGVVEC